jgi:23S rRNA pseudouridine2457 synthase
MERPSFHASPQCGKSEPPCYIRSPYIARMKRAAKPHYILFYKPYGVLTQFTREAGHQSLADFGPFPTDVYPVGRLDADSEGLLILTNDDRLKRLLTEPRFYHQRTYTVQVERIPGEQALQQLREGVLIEGKKTRPAGVTLLNAEPLLAPRPVPIRFRKNVPTSWIELTLTEGRNRQVRKMTAKVGHPTLRLVRTKIGELTLEGLLPGKSRPLTPEEIQRLRTIPSALMRPASDL